QSLPSRGGECWLRRYSPPPTPATNCDPGGRRLIS
ncbi:hypothetical protein scyTo_0005521, partial [Scyliorhinus torazame]|nr:hypothetical protein [Scyliorhinus torazame]